MQDFDTPTLTAFGIVLKTGAFLSDKLSLSAQMAALIDTGLRENLDALSDNVAPQDLPPGLRRRIIRQTAIALLHAGRNAELVHFAAAADPFPQLIKLKLQSLHKLRAFEDMIQEIDTQEAVTGHPDWLKQVMFTHRVKNVKSRLRLRPQDHAFFMDKMPDNWQEAIANLSGPVTPDDPDFDLDQMAGALIALRQNPADEVGDFTRRLTWSRNMLRYCLFLTRFNTQFEDTYTQDPAVQKIRLLLEQRNATVVQDDITSLTQAAAAGRSVLLSTAHAGFSDLESPLFNRIDLPRVVIAANANTSLKAGRRITLGTRGNFQTDFLKLVKIVKKAPHQIRIFPDGGKGGDLQEVDLLGCKIRLRPGAATLAWHSRAATFFTGARVEGSEIRIYLREGPVADKEMGREAFDQAFYAFYINCLKEIVLGDPENMVGLGGFWPYLTTKTL